MRYVYDDGGRAAAGWKGEAGDCVTRAVAIATGRPYQRIYDALSAGVRTQRLSKRSRHYRASARDGVMTRRKWFKDYMARLGWVWTPTMKIGSGCTVHLRAGELPAGRLIVALAHHYTAFIDGTVHDIFDPGDGRCVYGYWSKRSET